MRALVPTVHEKPYRSQLLPTKPTLDCLRMRVYRARNAIRIYRACAVIIIIAMPVENYNVPVKFPNNNIMRRVVY